MKTSRLLMALITVSMLTGGVAFGGDKHISLARLAGLLSLENPKLIVGFEQLPPLRSDLGIITDLTQKLHQLDALNDIITKATDYELIKTSEAIVIRPKDLPENNDKPLSERLVTIPEEKSILPKQLFGEIKSVDQLVRIDVWANSYSDIAKPISFAGVTKVKLGAALTAIAKQLGARRWDLSNHTFASGAPQDGRPFKLTSASVEFFR